MLPLIFFDWYYHFVVIYYWFFLPVFKITPSIYLFWVHCIIITQHLIVPQEATKCYFIDIIHHQIYTSGRTYPNWYSLTSKNYVINPFSLFYGIFCHIIAIYNIQIEPWKAIKCYHWHTPFWNRESVLDAINQLRQLKVILEAP